MPSLQNLQVHCFIHNSLPPVPVLRHSHPVHASPSHFLKIHINITLPFWPRSAKCSLTQFSPPKPYMHLSCLSYMPHTPSISFFSIWSSKYYLVRSTHHKASLYVLFFMPLLCHPSLAHISYSALCSWTHPAYIPPSVVSGHLLTINKLSLWL
jgi:hypothetical protein